MQHCADVPAKDIPRLAPDRSVEGLVENAVQLAMMLTAYEEGELLRSTVATYLSPGMLCPPGARGTGLPFARTGIATLKIA